MCYNFIVINYYDFSSSTLSIRISITATYINSIKLTEQNIVDVSIGSTSSVLSLFIKNKYTFIVFFGLYLFGLLEILLIELYYHRLEVLQERLFLFGLFDFPFDSLNFGVDQFFVVIDHREYSRDSSVSSEYLFDFILYSVEFIYSLYYFLLLVFGLFVYF